MWTLDACRKRSESIVFQHVLTLWCTCHPTWLNQILRGFAVSRKFLWTLFFNELTIHRTAYASSSQGEAGCKGTGLFTSQIWAATCSENTIHYCAHKADPSVPSHTPPLSIAGEGLGIKLLLTCATRRQWWTKTIQLLHLRAAASTYRRGGSWTAIWSNVITETMPQILGSLQGIQQLHLHSSSSAVG